MLEPLRIHRLCQWLSLLAGLLLLAGCASYSSRHANLRPELAAGEYELALQTIEKNKGGKDLLLYHLERALVLHYADRWAESNRVFQQAEALAADLYTKSISEGVFSLVISDNVIAYRAEPFEMAMIPYYRALNYIYLGEKEEAVVEARKASLYLRQYADLALGHEGEEDETDLDLTSALRNNAFLQYFSGLLYEWDGEVNDAFIAYRHAADAYATATRELAVSTPPWLGEDLRRTGRRLGFFEELERLEKVYPDLLADDAEGAVGDGAGESGSPAAGEVVLLLEFGYVAHKEQREINVPILKDEEHIGVDDWAESLSLRLAPGWSAGGRKIEYWLRIAMPELVSNRPEVHRAHVVAGIAGGHAVAVPVEDLEARAQVTFDAEKGTILLKTLARSISKYLATRQADNQSVVAGWLANILGAATESADTRSWLTLPNQINMVRLSLPAGEYDLQVDLVNEAGRTVSTETIVGVTVRAGNWSFLSRRIF